MGRNYAGILGSISFGTVIARGLLDRGNVESALLTAGGAMFAFAAIGYVVGQLAERIVVEAIRAQFDARWPKSDSSADGRETRNSSAAAPDLAA